MAFEKDIEFAFLFDNFVWRTYGAVWLDQASLGTLGALPAMASSALSQTTFGAAHHVQNIQVKGAIQYSKALKSLIPMLADPRKPGVEQMLIPIMILLIHAVRKGCHV